MRPQTIRRATFALLAIIEVLAMPAQPKALADYVNPLVGTYSTHDISAGNTYPAIAMPWGMNFWTPQTGKMGDGWQYVYTHNTIRGFKQTHQPSPWIGDYGQFSIMPITGEPCFDEDKRASIFSHLAETAHPYYYQVYLAKHFVNVELTPTERAAMFRFTFPDRPSYVVVDGYANGSSVTIDAENRRITGYTTRNCSGVAENFKNYFVVEFDQPFTYKAVADGKQIDNQAITYTGHHAGAIVGFATRKGTTVHARVASSFISPEQALTNLKELGNDSFDTLKEKGKQTWNNVLGRIEVEDDNVDHIRTFYSCLYRSLLFPRKFYEINANGEVVHYSPYNGKVLPGYLFADTGFWDTFRCLFPFLNLMYPSQNKEMQEGLLNTYRESGFFPEWSSPGHRNCMIGNNSASVLADAFMKGVRVADVETLYEGLWHGTQAVHPQVKSTGRAGFEDYNRYGYVPHDGGVSESAARTLEYAYNDWCILQVAKALNRPDEEIKVLEKRAKNYANLFDPEYKLMCGKLKNGQFVRPFSPLRWGDDFTEGNSWHYTWSVFHDPQGLIDLMGGEKEFVQMLDSVFSQPAAYDNSHYGCLIHEITEMHVANFGNYAHGNQPIQHAIYLYDWAGEPWKAQYWLRQVMRRLYHATPDGYCGDEDNGQTSAWFVFSALGFYPVCPASPHYAIGSPLFQKAVLHLENGKDLTLVAPSNNDENIYVGRITRNGKNYERNYLDHADLLKGGKIKFDMQAEPNTQRGTRHEDAPYSFSNENKDK